MSSEHRGRTSASFLAMHLVRPQLLRHHSSNYPSAMKCVLCSKLFDAVDRRPFVGLCGHTICLKCRGSLLSWKCPVSRRCRESGDGFIVSQPHFNLSEITESCQKRKNKEDRLLREFSEVRRSEEEFTRELEAAEKRHGILEKELDELKSSFVSEEMRVACADCKALFEEERLLRCQICRERGIGGKTCAVCTIEHHSNHDDAANSSQADITIVTISSDDGFEEMDDSVTEISEVVLDEDMPDSNFQKNFTDLSMDGSDDSITVIE